MEIGTLQVQNNSGHIIILPLDYSVIGQGTWVLSGSADRYFYFSFLNTSNADGDNLSYNAYLTKGTYSLILVADKYYSRGIVDIDIDGVEVASFDCYNASALNNVRFIETNIVILSNGLKTIKLRIDGKNASSSDYYFEFGYLALFRTA